MSLAKPVPDGLKDHECERSKHIRPPIPYVPAIDNIQEAVAGTQERTFTVKFGGGSEQKAPIFFSGTPEKFLLHVQEAISICRRKGLFDRYNTNLQASKKIFEKLTNAQEKIDELEVEKKSVPSTLRQQLASAQTDYAAANNATKESATAFFDLYANLLSEENRRVWNKIVSDTTDEDLWTDLNGKERTGKRGKSYQSFIDCTWLHLLKVFPHNAAELQRHYISTVIKKPQRVSIRHFFQRVEQLNGYLAHLPSVYYSPKANSNTKPVEPFDEAELGTHILRMIPVSWANQYNMSHGELPTRLNKLLTILETVEAAIETQAAAANKKTTANAKADKPNGNSEKNGKRKNTNSSADRTSKKQKKFCQLCKDGKFGGNHITHNTSECRRYNKDGTLKNPEDKKPSKNTNKKSELSNFAQLSESIAKIQKSLEKNKKASRKKKRHYSDSESDSE